MARKTRMALGGACYHVVSWVNSRGWIFKEDEAKQSFDECLAEAATRFLFSHRTLWFPVPLVLTYGLTLLPCPQDSDVARASLPELSSEIDRSQSPLHCLSVLLPCDAQNALPTLLRRPLPVTSSAQWARILEAWFVARTSAAA